MLTNSNRRDIISTSMKRHVEVLAPGEFGPWRDELQAAGYRFDVLSPASAWDPEDRWAGQVDNRGEILCLTWRDPRLLEVLQIIRARKNGRSVLLSS